MDPAALGSIIGGSDFDSEGFTSDEGANIEDQQPPSLDRLGLYQVCFVTFNKDLGHFHELLFIMEKINSRLLTRIATYLYLYSLHFDVFFI